MVNITIVRKTYSRARRRKTVKQNEGCVTRMGRVTGMRTVLKNKEMEVSAHWLINSAGRNEITLGHRFDETMTAASAANPRHVLDCYYSLCRHETCHGEFTGRNGEIAARECATAKMPFTILNLFEDCRIEHLSRAATGKKFRWSNWLELPERTDNAASWLWIMKVRETSAMSSPAAAMAAFEWTGAPRLKDGRAITRVIAQFYKRIVAAADVRDLVPMVIEWCTLFGFDRPATPEITNKLGNETDTNHHTDEAPGEAGVGAGTKGTGRTAGIVNSPELEKLIKRGIISREVEANYYR